MKILPQIDKPCPQSWQTMTGDDQCRFCTQCQLHVHNLSAMPLAQQHTLLAAAARSGQRTCIAYVDEAATLRVRSRSWLALQRLPRPLRTAATWLLFGLTTALTSCSTPAAPLLPATDPDCPPAKTVTYTTGRVSSGKIAIGIVMMPAPPLWQRILFFWKKH
ncbi:MAG: hypothetical protein V4672_21500 [Verrucomicrobiota bacterium]